MKNLRDQLTNKLMEFLEGGSRNFVDRLLKEMRSIAGLAGRGKEGRPRHSDYTSRRRDNSGGEVYFYYSYEEVICPIAAISYMHSTRHID